MSIFKKDKDGKEVPVSLEEVLSEVNKNIDTKIGAKFEDFTKVKLPEVLGSHLNPLTEQFTTMNQALEKIVTGGNGGGGNEGKEKAAPQGGSPEINATLRQLQETTKNQGVVITQLQSEKKDADARVEKTERHSSIKDALNGLSSEGLTFVNDAANKTAFSIVEPYVKRLDGGDLVAQINGENFPINSFAKDYLEKEHSYLFKSSGSSGSGAPSGPGNSRVYTRVDTGIIKPGMKAEDRQAVVDSINAALVNANS